MEFNLAMKKLLLTIAFCLFAPAAWAQCTGVFPANTVCGNLGVSPAPPGAFTATTSIIGPSGAVTSPHAAYWSNSVGNQLGDSGLPIFSVVIYGADPTGVADSSTALNNALTAANAAGGGTIIFPAGTYKITQQIFIPHDSSVPQPKQKQFRLTGQAGGSNWNINPGFPVGPGASILNMTYSSTTDCKLCSIGVGSLLIDNLTFEDTGSDATPFFLTTNTTVTIRANSFIGTNVASQNAIVLGGTSTGISNTTSSAFQGYSTSINNNTFTQVNNGVLLQTFANNINIVGNGFIHMATTSTAPIVSNGNIALPNSGEYIAGNTVEVTDSVYGVVFNLTINSVLDGNSFYDAGGNFISSYNFTNNSINNTIIRALDGTGGAKNFISGDQTSLQATSFIGGVGTKDTAAAGFANNELSGNLVIKGLYDSSQTYRGQLTLRDTSTTSAAYTQLSLNASNGATELRAHGGVDFTPVLINPDTACDVGGTNHARVGIGNTSPQRCLDVGGTVNTSAYYLNNSAKPIASSCGTSPTVATGSNNQSGQFTAGNSISACSITFANAYPTNAFCIVQPASAGITSSAVTFGNNTVFTVSWAPATSGSSFNYNCGGN